MLMAKHCLFKVLVTQTFEGVTDVVGIWFHLLGVLIYNKALV